MRHGTSISDKQIDMLLALFKILDRGGDPDILMQSETMRRYRATLQRIKNGSRWGFGGKKPEDI